MGRIQNYYDRFSADLTLAHGFVYLASYVILSCIGVLNVRGYFRTHDAFSMLFGPLALLVGVVGILHALQVIRTVAHRDTCNSQ